MLRGYFRVLNIGLGWGLGFGFGVGGFDWSLVSRHLRAGLAEAFHASPLSRYKIHYVLPHTCGMSLSVYI